MKNVPDLSQLDGFVWDSANTQKNWDRHKVAFYECEEIFFRNPVILADPEHSEDEFRFFTMGKSLRERYLTIVFTVRENKIRVISARDMSRKERREYGKIQKNSKI